MANPFEGDSGDTFVAGVTGKNTADSGTGVLGLGFGTNTTGVSGSGFKFGVEGTVPASGGANGVGVIGTGGAIGVRGFALLDISTGKAAEGFLGGKDPVFQQLAGVFGQSTQQGVMGLSNGDAGTGVFGGNVTGSGIGVRGETSAGVGVQGQSFGPGLAAKFIGDVEVTGDIRLIQQDLAEDFDIVTSEDAEPGTVMVLDEVGRLVSCQRAYETTVVGVVAGAAAFRPAIVLGRISAESGRQPIALVGKTYCKVDASFAPVSAGDLLTTSPSAGHAMKVADPMRAFGAVIGKALQPLATGRGLIPIVIALQ